MKIYRHSVNDFFDHWKHRRYQALLEIQCAYMNSKILSVNSIFWISMEYNNIREIKMESAAYCQSLKCY